MLRSFLPVSIPLQLTFDCDGPGLRLTLMPEFGVNDGRTAWVSMVHATVAITDQLLCVVGQKNGNAGFFNSARQNLFWRETLSIFGNRLNLRLKNLRVVVVKKLYGADIVHPVTHAGNFESSEAKSWHGIKDWPCDSLLIDRTNLRTASVIEH